MSNHPKVLTELKSIRSIMNGLMVEFTDSIFTRLNSVLNQRTLVTIND